MNYQRVLEFVSGSFEIFPSKCLQFENSLKLPRLVFSLSLIMYTKEFLSERLTRRGLKKLQELTKFAENDSVNVNLSTQVRYLKWGTCPDLQGAPYTQLVVKTGDKGEGYEPDGMSFCIIRAIKRAVNDAHFLSENKKALDNII